MTQEMDRISSVRRTMARVMVLAGLVGWGLGIGAVAPAESCGQAIVTTSSASATPGQFSARIHRDGALSLPYQLLIPKDYMPDADKSWPMIVWLHGSAENGTDNRAQLPGVANTFLSDGANTRAFVLLPQCPPKMAWHRAGFNKAPEVAESSRMLIATIAELEKEFRLDGRRIYVGGFSMGGIGVWELLVRYPGVFAAAFPVAGAVGDRPALPPLVKDVPIWVFHGDKDDMVSVEDARKTVAALKALGSTIKYTEYSGVGHQCARALAEPQLPVWLFAQKREATADFELAKVPDGALLITRGLPAGTHDTWTGPVQHTLHGAPRLTIGELRYRLRPAKNAETSLAGILDKIGKGEITAPCQVTGTIEIEDYAWLTVERIEVKK